LKSALKIGAAAKETSGTLRTRCVPHAPGGERRQDRPERARADAEDGQ